eukprot:scaffold674629_cov64-Prasinocladus_malaysianus.AAC.1
MGCTPAIQLATTGYEPRTRSRYSYEYEYPVVASPRECTSTRTPLVRAFSFALSSSEVQFRVQNGSEFILQSALCRPTH